MKLYYAPGACSMAVHIVLEELGTSYEMESVDLRTKHTETGRDFNDISHKGLVPVLELDSGETLTEGVAILQFVADLHPQSKLATPNRPLDRARLHECLNYIATELHKAHWPILFADRAGEQARTAYTEKLKAAYDTVSLALADQPFLLGDNYSIADFYLFTILGWNPATELDLENWPSLIAFQRRIAVFPTVRRVLESEGVQQRFRYPSSAVGGEMQ